MEKRKTEVTSDWFRLKYLKIRNIGIENRLGREYAKVIPKRSFRVFLEAFCCGI